MNQSIYDRLKAIIEQAAPEFYTEPEPGRFCLMLPEFGIRINWRKDSDNIGVYLWQAQRAVYYGCGNPLEDTLGRPKDVERLSCTTLPAILIDLGVLKDGCGARGWGLAALEAFL